MIEKKELMGKHIQFIDKQGATRICKCYKVNGKTLTVGTVWKRHRLHWQRIHPDKDTIHGAIIRRKLVEIAW